MANTLQTSINWAACFVGQIPLSAGTGNEPALSCANMILDTILGPPFRWAFNRNTSTLALISGTQDYTAALTDFGFLERATLTPSSGTIFEIKDIYNNLAGPVAGDSGRSNAIYAQSNVFGVSQSFRFLPVPNAAYTCGLVYQKLPTHMTATTNGWSGIPDQYSNIYNTLFLADMFELAYNDQKAAYYRQRGVLSLLALAEGLTETDKNMFLEQYLMRDSQSLSRQLKTQQGTQARGA